jgi:IclR family pca regulon transcriptional regulator
MLSLSRGLQVIRAFGDGRGDLSVADVARATGFSRAAARRCLHTLSTLGYAIGRQGRYELTPRILALGYAYLGSTPLARTAQPVLERVAEALHESSSLAVLDGQEIVYVARAATSRILSIGLSVGSRLPADCTSMGRVLLAFADPDVRARYLASVTLVRHTARTIVEKQQLRDELDRVHEHAYAMVDQELEDGLRSIAVPVFGRDRLALAAVNVGVHAGRVDQKTLVRDFLPVLRDAASDIGLAIGPALR